MQSVWCAWEVLLLLQLFFRYHTTEEMVVLLYGLVGLASVNKKEQQPTTTSNIDQRAK